MFTKNILKMLLTSLCPTFQLVELKNGETYNGHLVSCDNWMNINLREVICTSRVSGLCCKCMVFPCWRNKVYPTSLNPMRNSIHSYCNNYHSMNLKFLWLCSNVGPKFNFNSFCRTVTGFGEYQNVMSGEVT